MITKIEDGTIQIVLGLGDVTMAHGLVDAGERKLGCCLFCSNDDPEGEQVPVEEEGNAQSL